MSGFPAEWLALREPADRRARDPHLLAQAAALAQARGGPVVDLGAGTGSTRRAMAPHLDAATPWRLVDADAALLAEARREEGPGVETIEADLAALPEGVFAGAALVTASALLDLLSAEALDGLAARLRGQALPFYAALSVDGRVRWAEPHPLDAAVAAAFAAHQRGDKGLGAALGPDAPRRAARAFRDAGFAVMLADSPWRLGAPEAALHRAFVQGFAEAAAETGRLAEGDLAAWLTEREAAARRGAALLVGHIDLLARPA